MTAETPASGRASTDPRSLALDEVAHHATSVLLEGRIVHALLTVDEFERQRRVVAGLKAVTSLSALHALWELPGNVRWPEFGLSDTRLDRLQRLGPGLVRFNDGEAERIYQPIGRVSSICITRTRLRDAVLAVGAFPPIFRRVAHAPVFRRGDEAIVNSARSLGIGISIGVGSAHVSFAAAGDPLGGRPSVYQWWLAEKAYAASL